MTYLEHSYSSLSITKSVLNWGMGREGEGFFPLPFKIFWRTNDLFRTATLVCQSWNQCLIGAQEGRGSFFPSPYKNSLED